MSGVCFWLAVGAPAGDRPAPSYQKPKAKGLVVPYYHGQPPRLGVMFHVDRVFTDYQRKGFLRIGLLPFLVAEGVTVDVRDPAVMEESLGSLRKWAETGDRKKLGELRGVRFTFPASLNRSLEAGKVRLADHGDWALENGVKLQLGEATVSTGSASLRVAGPDAGLLRWEQDGAAQAFNLFRADPPKPPPIVANQALP